MADQKKFVSKLAGSRVFIIGGSSGIGFSVAEGALEYGASVSISSSQESRVQASVERLKKSYPSASSRIHGYACDLATEEGLEDRIKGLFEKVGKVDHIVFTAGDHIATIPIADITLDRIKAAGMVRFFSPLLVAKIGPKYLTPGPASSITFTTGSVSQKPLPEWTVVGSYAAGLHGMTRNLALDLKPIRVNLVSPGGVNTELWSGMPKDEREELQKSFAKKSTTGRIGRPEDVAESYLYAMKDHNLSGTVISSNGGALLL